MKTLLVSVLISAVLFGGCETAPKLEDSTKVENRDKTTVVSSPEGPIFSASADYPADSQPVEVLFTVRIFIEQVNKRYHSPWSLGEIRVYPDTLFKHLATSKKNQAQPELTFLCSRPGQGMIGISVDLLYPSTTEGYSSSIALDVNIGKIVCGDPDGASATSGPSPDGILTRSDKVPGVYQVDDDTVGSYTIAVKTPQEPQLVGAKDFDVLISIRDMKQLSSPYTWSLGEITGTTDEELFPITPRPAEGVVREAGAPADVTLKSHCLKKKEDAKIHTIDVPINRTKYLPELSHDGGVVGARVLTESHTFHLGEFPIDCRAVEEASGTSDPGGDKTSIGFVPSEGKDSETMPSSPAPSNRPDSSFVDSRGKIFKRGEIQRGEVRPPTKKLLEINK